MDMVRRELNRQIVLPEHIEDIQLVVGMSSALSESKLCAAEGIGLTGTHKYYKNPKDLKYDFLVLYDRKMKKQFFERITEAGFSDDDYDPDCRYSSSDRTKRSRAVAIAGV